MSKTVNPLIAITVFGDGLGPTGQPFAVWSQTNTNAPEPGGASLVGGNNTIQVPAGRTVTGVLIIPAPATANAKTLKGVNGDTGLGGAAWTTQAVIAPVVAGGTFVIVSAGNEEVVLVWM